MTETPTPSNIPSKNEQPFDYLAEEPVAKEPVIDFFAEEPQQVAPAAPPTEFLPEPVASQPQTVNFLDLQNEQIQAGNLKSPADVARDFIGATPPKTPTPQFLDDEADQAVAIANSGNSTKPLSSSAADFEALVNTKSTQSPATFEQTPSFSQPVQPVTKELPVNSKEAPKNNQFKKIAAGAAAITAGAVAVVAGAQQYEKSSTPEFTDNTTTYTVEQGDGVFDAAEQIKGVETIDIRKAVEEVQNNPANAPVLKDGLQPGEQLVIPTAVEGHEKDK